MNLRSSNLTDEQQEEAHLISAILGYLAEHPQAGDTADGIAQWWILRQKVRLMVGRVNRALELLAERGILEATGSGPQRRYQLKPGVHLRVDLPEAEGPETRWASRSTETT
jgi:hypothetical protein